jgi:hypothetical protein
VGREIREDIDALAKKQENAVFLEEDLSEGRNRSSSSSKRYAELLVIMEDTKRLIDSIDDVTPSINLWVSSLGGIQTEPASFSPSRLLQASYLVNVGDTQYIIDPSQPMQIGPDFTLSVYMLFRGHASQNREPYGLEDGQRKPMWQEVVHKARVRLYRMPPDSIYTGEPGFDISLSSYIYQLQIVENLDDGRLHTFEDGNMEPGPYNGVSSAGIRELIPVAQISKLFYADVGRILNITNEDGASSNPVLLLKRDVQQISPETFENGSAHQQSGLDLIECFDDQSILSNSTLSDLCPQDDVDRQLREESQSAEIGQDGSEGQPQILPTNPGNSKPPSQWSFSHNLDPEWIAMEVFEIDDSTSSTDEDEDEPTPEEEEDLPTTVKPRRTKATPRTSVDINLVNQLNRMGLASSAPSSRPSSSHSQVPSDHPPFSTSTELANHHHHHQSTTAQSPTTLIERSPFGAIKTSLSLLEMLLRLTSLQEFEQTTHLAIPDHVLKFYLDESASESGLHGKERWAARAEAARKVGFDPYVDAPTGDKNAGLWRGPL